MKIIDVKEMFDILGTTQRVRQISKNHVIVEYTNGSALFSYHTLVAAYANYDMYFTKYHNHSVTTSKWVTKYCGVSAKYRNKLLEDELATLINY